MTALQPILAPKPAAEPEGCEWPAMVGHYDGIGVDGALDIAPRRTLLDPDLQATLERDGYVVIPLLDEDRQAEAMRAFERLGPAPGDPRTGFFQGNHGTSVPWKRDVLAALEPILADPIARTFDDHRSYVTTFLLKWPGPDGALPPHVDPSMVDREDVHRGVTMWCPLTAPAEAPDDDGSLRVVPGSHLMPAVNGYRAKGGHAWSPIGPWHAELWKRAVPLRARPGEAILFDHRTVHCSAANTTDKTRIVVAAAMYPAEAHCVHIESDSTGRVDCYRIDEEYYMHNPTVGTLEFPLFRSFQREEPPPITEQDLERLPVWEQG